MLRYTVLYKEFKKAVPESVSFCEAQEKMLSLDENIDGQHILFHHVVLEYIRDRRDDEEQIRKIFNFISRMLDDDDDIASVAYLSIIEYIIEDEDDYKHYAKFMPKNMLDACKESEYFIDRGIVRRPPAD